MSDSPYTRGRRRPHGIFCLEADWPRMRRGHTVKPLLDVLRSSMLEVPSIHRHVATHDSLLYYLGKWTQKAHADFRILYFAVHGVAGEVQFGDLRLNSNCVHLDLIEEHLAGKCAGRLLHCSSCRTIDLPATRIQRFLARTGALGISGYLGDVDWIRSIVFDLAFLATLQENAMTGPGLRAVRTKMLERHSREAKRLRFDLILRTGR
jgi:hypothetical protein